MDMDLKVGDIVEFKKYEDMSYNDRAFISEKFFPKSGKVKEINVNGIDEFFNILGNPCTFSKVSVSRVISDVDDIDVNSLKPGDEVLMKAVIRKINGNHVSFSWVNNNKGDIVKILKRKEPDHFIVKEDYYGMYIGDERELISDKSKAKIYTSRNAANEAAADLRLNAWEVIPYGD